MKIAILSRYYGKAHRGVETFVTELSHRLQIRVYPSIFSAVDPQTQIIISTNGRLDAVITKIWCLLHGAKLVIPGQSGLGWDDKLNLWLFPDVFVALTDYQHQWAKKINPFVKIVKIPNGVDLKKFNPNIKSLKLTLKKPIILNVGVVSPLKRQDLLIKAAAKIQASVLLVGSGGNMTFTHKDMPGIYTACNLFSYPTLPHESFGIAILEAMASGLSVVATDDPIRREIIGNAGLFVDPTDTDAFATAIQTALKTDWGNKPRLQAQKFSWDDIALQYNQLFETI